MQVGDRSDSDAGSRLERAERVLETVWGYGAFRPLQRRTVLAVLAGRDVLAVLPTGGGKSLCFQVPALLLPGLTVVVSPLISLMQDQVGALRRRGVPAAYLSSTQPAEVRRHVWDRVGQRRLKLLYVAPERLASASTRLRGRVSLLAVDEAHCISEWGHEFRPQYRAIGRFRRALGGVRTVAVTASATPETRADVVRSLGLRRPVTILDSFDRANLRLAVQRAPSDGDRLVRTSTLLRAARGGSAIVYVPTRDRTDGTASILRAWGFRAVPYHAGLPGDDRRRLLGAFLRGEARVVVATNAFGMGIDKPDVRLVVHLGVPPRPEAYYQEAGRAGRDGAPSDCVLLWQPRDLTMALRLAGKGPAAEVGYAAMRRYVTRRVCRRRVLLGYLGERVPTPCGGCDVCLRV
jgi:ATP-dependent DNA helicase RecQ